jgi:hypothetical protein
MLLNRKLLLVAITLVMFVAIRFVASKDSEQKRPDRFKPRILESQPIAVDVTADPLTRLRAERRNAAVTALKANAQLFLNGRGPLSEVITSAERAVAAQLDAPGSSKKTVLEEHLEFARMLHALVGERYDKGVVDVTTKTAAEYWNLEMEIRVERDKQDSKS